MILGLHGNTDSGKDTFADFLVERHGFKKIGLGDKIKEIAYDLDVSVSYTDDDGKTRVGSVRKLVDRYGFEDLKDRSMEFNQFLVSIGQGLRKHLGDDVWIRAIETEVWSAKNQNHNIVIKDVRQINEFDFIRKLGGRVIRIIRPGTEAFGIDSLLDDQLKFRGVTYDYSVNNGGSKEALGIHASNIYTLINNDLNDSRKI